MGAAGATCSVAADDSEIRLGVSATATVAVFTGSDFGSTGSVLTIAAGSTVLAGTALVLEAVTDGTTWVIMFAPVFDWTVVTSDTDVWSRETAAKFAFVLLIDKEFTVPDFEP